MCTDRACKSTGMPSKVLGKIDIINTDHYKPALLIPRVTNLHKNHNWELLLSLPSKCLLQSQFLSLTLLEPKFIHVLVLVMLLFYFVMVCSNIKYKRKKKLTLGKAWVCHQCRFAQDLHKPSSHHFAVPHTSCSCLFCSVLEDLTCTLAEGASTP